jgi:uncharacterized membrane protein
MSIFVIILVLAFYGVAFTALVGATVGIWLTVFDHIKDRSRGGRQ